MREIDKFFLKKNEPVKSCLHFLRLIKVNYDKKIKEVWKFKMPFIATKVKCFAIYF